MTAREIKLTPGPGDYDTYGIRGTTTNHMLNHGWDSSKGAYLKPDEPSIAFKIPSHNGSIDLTTQNSMLGGNSQFVNMTRAH
jgi:hypothetical protein